LGNALKNLRRALRAWRDNLAFALAGLAGRFRRSILGAEIGCLTGVIPGVVDDLMKCLDILVRSGVAQAREIEECIIGMGQSRKSASRPIEGFPK
jgi:hypothetical protein